MIKVENVETWGFEHAIRGMRNPLNSWDKSDSKWEYIGMDDVPNAHAFIIGDNDLDLMQRLYKAGTEHRKYLRQIFVSMDIVAPLYWISEMDTYKVGTSRNSCSFMHTGLSNPFDINCFSHHSNMVDVSVWGSVIDELNRLRDIWLNTKNPAIFQEIRDLLPSGYNLRFTLTMNYENVVNMIHQRSDHKLSEWREFTDILKDLPYVREIMES